ncbi:MAG: TetR/AcrR family transcriptional regulator [Actinomycetota bacterium]
MKDNQRTQAARSAATREALVAAARSLFAQHGFGEVGTETIVRAAGVTRGALYHHFADKTELYAAVFEAVEAEVIGRIAETVASSGEPDLIVVMRLGASTWLDACAEPEIYRIVLLDAPAVLGWARWREIGERYGMGLVQGLLAQAVDTGRIARQPVAPLAHVLLGALREGALYMAGAQDQAEARQEVGAAIDRLIDSLG